MNLMKYKKIFFLISAFFLVPGLISLALFGLKPAIDFTGGSLMEIEFLEEEKLSAYQEESFKDSLREIFEINTIQLTGENNLILKGKEISNENKDIVLETISQQYGELELLRFESAGPLLGKELLKKTFIAILLVSGVIIFYIWRQFNEIKYGISAVLAMFHDSLILIGIFSLLGYFKGVEVDLLFVTAVLTTLSFSIHDTVVVYNRIRELQKKQKHLSLTAIANAAVWKTLGRSINDSVTIILMLLSLVLLGGESIHYFSLALLIGAITGTYSSTFTAVPILLVWEEIVDRRKNKEK